MTNRWTMLALVFFARTSSGFQFQALASIAPLVVADLHLSYAQLGTLIGLVEDGRPVLGLMSQPFTGERFWADRRRARMRGPDGKPRCWWSLGSEDYLDYHDSEWGWQLHGETELFERSLVEMAPGLFGMGFNGRNREAGQAGGADFLGHRGLGSVGRLTPRRNKRFLAAHFPHQGTKSPAEPALRGGP